MMSIIISDKDKLIQDLGKRMTKVTDVYSTTHVVVHWGDVQAIVEKFFMDKNSDWLMAKTEPTISKMEQVDEPKTCDTCKWGEWYQKGYDITMMSDECGGCCSWNSKWAPKDDPQTERSE